MESRDLFTVMVEPEEEVGVGPPDAGGRRAWLGLRSSGIVLGHQSRSGWGALRVAANGGPGEWWQPTDGAKRRQAAAWRVPAPGR